MIVMDLISDPYFRLAISVIIGIVLFNLYPDS